MPMLPVRANELKRRSVRSIALAFRIVYTEGVQSAFTLETTAQKKYDNW
tara:strand:- start:434 stop:580 length:147 start_codon:yes stop_codon:yes gene_type:complete